ncbi:MAG: histidine triad nucleotide-binding protein [Gammaproteobacteria bacterium]|nr:histidine triad nucleotide-binding protein [Gammaproteobacteria bacterium]
MDCLFCKIINREIPASIIHETDNILVFDDINPQAPIHKLIIPKEHISTLNDINEGHKILLGEMLLTASELAKKLGVSEPGYRTIFNCNKDAGQIVFHVHMHFLAGRTFNWPPG